MMPSKMKALMVAALVVSVTGLVGSAHGGPLTTWSWKSGDAPYVAPFDGRSAVFNDNDGAVWKFQSLTAGVTDATTWTTLSGIDTQYYLTGGTYWGCYNYSDSPGSTNAYCFVNQSGGDNRDTALVFVAPVAGQYSVSGKAWIGNSASATTLLTVGKVQNGSYSSLKDTFGDYWTVGPEFSSFPELTNVSLGAGDAIAFLLPYYGGTQKWWLADHTGAVTGNLDVENNALTITLVPEPASVVLLLGLGMLPLLRRRTLALK